MQLVQLRWMAVARRGLAQGRGGGVGNGGGGRALQLGRQRGGRQRGGRRHARRGRGAWGLEDASSSHLRQVVLHEQRPPVHTHRLLNHRKPAFSLGDTRLADKVLLGMGGDLCGRTGRNVVAGDEPPVSLADLRKEGGVGDVTTC